MAGVGQLRGFLSTRLELKARLTTLSEISDLRATGLLAGALVLVTAMRSFVAPMVFRGVNVVLSGNDPYYYLYWVERSLAASDGATQLPLGIIKGEPLLVVSLLRITDLVGGSETASAVLAVYPVVSALLTGVFLYVLSIRLTADRRIALAAVVVLALMPAHALRTALGFADHHAFDYIWLTLTAAALAILTGVADRDTLQAPRIWFAILALGIGVGAQNLAWEAGPLLLTPIAILMTVRVLLNLYKGRSPLLVNAPLLTGLALGAVVTLYGHLSLGWHTEVVASASVLLLIGSVTIVAVAEFFHRFERSLLELVTAEIVVTVTGVWYLWRTFPKFRSELLTGLDRVFRSANIAEVQPLFSGDTFGFLLLFGLFLILALPVFLWATRRSVDDTRWVVACSYGWYFFALSLYQVRFTGQLGIFISLFAGIGLVWFGAKIDITAQPQPFERTASRGFASWIPNRPNASTAKAVLLLFVLLCGFGLLQSAVKVQQVTTDTVDYQTATWLADYADGRGWETPEESYVFTKWGKNRLYNYFVNHDSRSYGYAKENYGSFMIRTNPQKATDMLANRVRFVVTQPRDAGSETMHARLHDNLGSRSGNVGGVARFRAVYTTEDGERKAVYVSGATIRGTAPANSTVGLQTHVDIPGTSFTYRRETTTNKTGVYSVTVPYPGTYNIMTVNKTYSVKVPESAVMNGTTVKTTAFRQ